MEICQQGHKGLVVSPSDLILLASTEEFKMVLLLTYD